MVEFTNEFIITLASILSSAFIAYYTTRVNNPNSQEVAKMTAQKVTRIWSQSEEICFTILNDIEGFYVGHSDKEEALKLKQDFTKAYRHIWLYSSDEVIKAINAFIISQGYIKQNETPQIKAVAEMVYQMRKTIYYGKTQLKPEDFLVIKVV